jgi:hypothetical protein
MHSYSDFVLYITHSAKSRSKTQPKTEVMDKKQQKKILTDIMNEDAENGVYDTIPLNPDNIKTKPFNIALVRDITYYWDLGEVSFSRMVEMLNEIAIEWHEKHIGDVNKMVEHHIVDTNKMITAVEWLIEQCPRIETIVAYNILEQAKQMEKEQIEEAIDKVLISYGIIKLKSNGTKYF